jgi:hypothetical protein
LLQRQSGASTEHSPEPRIVPKIVPVECVMPARFKVANNAGGEAKGSNGVRFGAIRACGF